MRASTGRLLGHLIGCTWLSARWRVIMHDAAALVWFAALLPLCAWFGWSGFRMTWKGGKS